jgi:hypothetical protein
MSVPCQRIEYKYHREPFPHSARWQRTAHVVSQLPETGDLGFLRQSGEKDTFSGLVPVESPNQVARPDDIHAPTSARKNNTRRRNCPEVHLEFYRLSMVARSLNCSPVIFAPQVEGILGWLFTSS